MHLEAGLERLGAFENIAYGKYANAMHWGYA